MKGKVRLILLMALMVLLLMAALLYGCRAEIRKSYVGSLFQNRRQEFEAAAWLIQSEGRGEREPELPRGTSEMLLCGADGSCVDFTIGGSGLGPSTTYWGIVYTTGKEPVGFQGAALDYIFDGEGWSWQEEDGDNRAYVTKLDDHWYFYEMSF